MKTDCEWLADMLADGRWRSLNEILQASFRDRGHGLTVHSRAADLRKRGYIVEHRTVGKRGAGSVYRLVGSLTEGSGYELSAVDARASSAGATVVPSVSEQLGLLPPPPRRRGAYTENAA